MVTAFVHSTNPFSSTTNVHVITGDIHDPETVAKAIQGTDVVISALGSWGTPTKDIVSSGMKTILPAMKSAKVSRIITLTGSGARINTDQPSFSDKIGYFLFKLVSKKIIDDGETHIRMLQASDTEWTILRSPGMRSSGKYGNYYITMKAPSMLRRVHRSDVADAMVAQLTDTSFYHNAPFISNVK